MFQAGDQSANIRKSQTLDIDFGMSPFRKCVTKDEVRFKREEFAISLRKEKRNQNLKIKRQKDLSQAWNSKKNDSKITV